MRIKLLPALIAVVLMLGMSSKLTAQAGTNATGGGESGCWGCHFFFGNQCDKDQPQGYWNCNWSPWSGANCTSPGCGGGSGSIPVGADGVFIYASTGTTDGLDGGVVKRECDGVVVARVVTRSNERDALNRTAVLVL
jgi:hypothetical protein